MTQRTITNIQQFRPVLQGLTVSSEYNLINPLGMDRLAAFFCLGVLSVLSFQKFLVALEY